VCKHVTICVREQVYRMPHRFAYRTRDLVT
jgi:hypothetical protein